MKEKKQIEKQIEFKKCSHVKLKKYCPKSKNKINKIDIVKYASHYDYKYGESDIPQDKLYL